MYCKYCGKHLYQEITFYNVFKWNYYIHQKCLQLMKHNHDYITIPVQNKTLQIDYIFPVKFNESDEEFLFLHYGRMLFERLPQTEKWSIVLIDWEWLTPSVLGLVINLVEESLLVISVFDENLH